VLFLPAAAPNPGVAAPGRRLPRAVV